MSLKTIRTRYERISKEHDIIGCQIDDCRPCLEYYRLLREHYEVVNAGNPHNKKHFGVGEQPH